MEKPNSMLEAPLLQSNSSGTGKVTIDEMLRKHCGELGKWQLRHFALTSIVWTLEAFHVMVMIFADRQPPFQCFSDVACDDVSHSLCDLPPGSWEWIGGPAVSTVAQWGLFCGGKFKVGLVQSAFFGGCMIGAGVFGHLSDSALGRKGSLIAVCFLNALFGFLTSLSPNYYVYLLLRTLTGFSTGGAGLCAFVLATEPVGPMRRGIAGMSTFYFFSAGLVLLSGTAYLCNTWRQLFVASSLPSLIFLVFILPFVSESPRWHLVRGQTTEAMKIMHRIAAANGRSPIPQGLVLALDSEVNEMETKRETSGSIVDVLKTPVTRTRLFLAVAINFLCAVVYYGLSLNVVNLGTNIYVNVVVNAVAEMPAFAITAVLLGMFGRKPLAIGTLWFSSVFCFAAALMKGEGVWRIARMMCGVMGIFGVAGSYNLLFIYTAELFPTVVRNAALGCASQAGEIGAILAPVVVVLGESLPFAAFGVCGFVGGILGFCLPETLNRPLYDTMAGLQEGECS